jgi:hypothetical protein
MPDCAIASLGRRRPRFSVSEGAENGSTAKEIDRPATRFFRLSSAKRGDAVMPDSPAVSRAQLSAFAAPSEVTTPGRDDDDRPAGFIGFR